MRLPKVAYRRVLSRNPRGNNKLGESAPHGGADASSSPSKPATATQVGHDTMNGANNNQSHASSHGNNPATGDSAPAHHLPPRPLFPPRPDKIFDTAGKELARHDRGPQEQPSDHAQRHQQRPVASQTPVHSGFVTENLPLGNTPHGAPPYVGPFGHAERGPFDGHQSLSHWFTGQGPFDRAPPSQTSSGAAFPHVFVPGFAPPPPFPFPFPPPFPPPPLASAAFQPPPPPPADMPQSHAAASGAHDKYGCPNLIRSSEVRKRLANGNYRAGTPIPRQDKKKDPKIYLPAPIPSQPYLKQATLQAEVRFPPSRKLVILDLNGTLLHRPNGRKQPKKMIARPSLQPCLRYLFDNFAVMIWSSARPENVKALVEIGLGEYEKRLVACWARDTLGLQPKHYHANVQCYKNLDRIWASDDIQRHMPGYESGARFDQRNTILIDDSSLKAAAQPHNLLEIPEFKGVDANTPVQDVLSEVVGYLEVLKMQEDVSKFIHKDPFRANGDWRIEWAELGLGDSR